MLRRFALLLACPFLFTPVLFAHATSVSTGEIRIDGTHAGYELHMPMYEAAAVANAESALLSHLRFADARLTRSTCQDQSGIYTCHAEYEFPQTPGDEMDVECRLFEITVPNHVHLLTVVNGPNLTQVVFDQQTPRAAVRFKPASRVEALLSDAVKGAGRILYPNPIWLVILSLAIASRSRREAAALFGAFLGMQILARLYSPWLNVAVSQRFFDAALGLTSAYFAAEVWWLPEGRSRWVAALVPGAFAGLPMAALPAGFLAGALPMQLLAGAALSALILALPEKLRRPAAGASGVLGLALFADRVLAR